MKQFAGWFGSTLEPKVHSECRCMHDKGKRAVPKNGKIVVGDKINK